MHSGRTTAGSGALLVLLLGACTPSHTSGSASDDVRTPETGATAECRVTPGEPPQEFGFSAASASRVRLAPGMEVMATDRSRAAARRGKPLLVFGRILAADCATPLPGATIQVWQTNGDGDYGPPGDNGHPKCCYLTGTLTADDSGRYEIITVMPGHYRDAQPPPPAHIHFDVRSPTEGGIMTEFDFAGDPALSSPGSADDEDHPIVAVRRAASGTPTLQAEFDIVLGTP